MRRETVYLGECVDLGYLFFEHIDDQDDVKDN